MSLKQLTIDDVCAARHQRNEEIREANPSGAAKRKAHWEILNLMGSVDLFGRYYTSKEIARIMKRPLNAISGRLSELRVMGEIEPTGERREGAAVLRRSGKRKIEGR